MFNTVSIGLLFVTKNVTRECHAYLLVYLEQAVGLELAIVGKNNLTLSQTSSFLGDLQYIEYTAKRTTQFLERIS